MSQAECGHVQEGQGRPQLHCTCTGLYTIDTRLCFPEEGVPITPPEITWKLGLGLGYGSQVEREFSWYLKGPLKAWEMALRLKTHTAEAAMLFLGGGGTRKREEGRKVREPRGDPTQRRHLPQNLRITVLSPPRDEVESVTGVPLWLPLGENKHLSVEARQFSSDDTSNPARWD